MKIKLIKFGLLGVILLLANQLSAATNGSPVKLLQRISTQTVNELKTHPKTLNNVQWTQVVRRIVNQKLLPHVDLDKMSGMVLGRNVWLEATTQQKKAFKHQFKNLLISTYAGALKNVGDRKIKFRRIRGGYQGKMIVQVTSIINTPGQKPINVVYHLEKKNNRWLVYDLDVAGVSFLESFKAQFAPTLQQPGGLDKLNVALDAHNKKLAAQ